MKYAWIALALLVGCSAAPQEDEWQPVPQRAIPVSAPVVQPPPADMVEAVLNPQPEVPPPPEVSVAEAATADVLSAAGEAFDKYLENAVNAPAAPPKPTVKLLSAEWCILCPAAKKHVKPWLESKGYVVEVVDCTDEKVAESFKAGTFPQYIFEKDGKEVCRVDLSGLLKGGVGVYEPHFAEAIRRCPPKKITDAPGAGSSFGMPTLQLSEWSYLIAGKTFEFGGCAQLVIPANVTWTARPTANSVVLTFPQGCRPQLHVRKFLVFNANPELLSLEIGPNFFELKTNSSASFLETARIGFDWSAPKVRRVAARRPYWPQRKPYYPQPRPVPQNPKQAEAEPTPAPPEPIKLGKSAPTVVQVAHAWRATVSVWVKDERTTYDIFGIPTVKECKGAGSGMIVSPQGHILTCNHVIDGVKSIEVEFCDGQKRPIKLVTADKELDLAILKVEGIDLPTVVFDVEQPKIGADAYIVGNPMGMGESVARGVVSGFNRELETKHLKYAGMLQVAVPINPGNSGGPVVNTKGDVIGVVTAMYDGEGLMFCMPASRAKAFVDKVVK